MSREEEKGDWAEKALGLFFAVGILFLIVELVSLIAGILILVMPRLLNLIVAINLIVIGLIGLFGGHLHL